jgi:quinol-cytochrome oxidoreductase complex cytochrome b subunit
MNEGKMNEEVPPTPTLPRTPTVPRDGSRDRGIKVTQWDGHLREGPGAATTAVPIIEVDGHGGHALEPPTKRMPIGPDHILYPIMVSLALFPILIGASGHHLADDLPEEETHPFFPDHFWPYPIIMLAIVVGLGLLSAFVGQNMQLEKSADPRAVVVPRPDWYFLFLFQFLKLGQEVVMAIIIPTIVGLGLLIWPLIDQIAGPRLARVLHWDGWPVPGRNVITGTGWVLFLGFIVLLTFWALAGVTILGITGG